MSVPAENLPPLTPEEKDFHTKRVADQSLSVAERLESTLLLRSYGIELDDGEEPEPAKLPENFVNDPSSGKTRSNLRMVGAGAAPPKREVILKSLSQIESRSIEWLWEGRIPLGTVSLIAGDPGDGKSTLIGALAATVSVGGFCPDNPSRPIEAGNVVILTNEENHADAVRPRLEKLGADLDRIRVVEMVRDAEGRETDFSLSRDIPNLEEAILKTGGANLVIIDPISSYIVGADEHKNAEVRLIIDPLFKMAERHRLAVVLVAHLNKGGGTNVLYRISGSIAFSAAPRMVWFYSRHPLDRAKRVLTFVKGNPPDALRSGLAVSFIDGKLVWDSEPVDWTAMDVVRLLQDEARRSDIRGSRGPRPEAAEKSVEFLLNLLAGGPWPRLAAAEKALQLGIKESTFNKSVKLLREKLKRVEAFTPEGDSRQWLRLLPPPVVQGQLPLEPPPAPEH